MPLLTRNNLTFKTVLRFKKKCEIVGTFNLNVRTLYSTFIIVLCKIICPTNRFVCSLLTHSLLVYVTINMFTALIGSHLFLF